MYILAFLDRANLGFAKAALQADTGLSDSMFAFGAGIFFLGYSIFEVPSNLIMHRIGARRWMCRIMVTWGIISSLMMFAHTETSFYVLRFLLGVAEAGFFPGVIYYLTYWFPARNRAGSVGFFYFGIPLSLVLGGPLSGYLLEWNDVGGLQGWQWMFLVEGALAVIVGIWAFWYLDSKPHDARWLSTDEKSALNNLLASEASLKNEGPSSVWKALVNKRVLFLCLVYFLIQICLYGVVYYLPTKVASLTGKNVGLVVGIITTIPWLCALAAAYIIPRWSDRSGERRKIAGFTLLVAAAGIAVLGVSESPSTGLIALCFATAGIIAVQPIFWTFPTAYLTGTAAAGGIAFINSIGTLGGFVAPNLKTWAEIKYSSASAGFLILAASAFVGSILVLISHRAGIKGKMEGGKGKGERGKGKK
jgi:MFS family permease